MALTGGFRAAFTVKYQGQTVREVLVPGAFYLNNPKTMKDRWVKITKTGTDPASKALRPLMEQLEKSTDPRFTLPAAIAGMNVTREPSGQVDGTSVERYRLEVSGEQIAAALRQSRPDLASKYDLADAHLVITFAAHGDQLRQIETATSVPGGQVTLRMTYSHWGEPVTIKIPKKSKTVRAAAVLPA